MSEFFCQVMSVRRQHGKLKNKTVQVGSHGTSAPPLDNNGRRQRIRSEQLLESRSVRVKSG